MTILLVPRSISAFEHQLLHVGAGSGHSAITAHEAAQLALLSEARPGFCTLGYQSVRLAQYAGLVGMGDRFLEILPKVEAEGGTSEVGRGIFLRLLRLSKRMNIFADASVQQDLRKQSLLEVFIAAYFDEVVSLIHKGLLRRYQTVEDDIAVIRGRLRIERQAMANAMRVDRIACRFDELTADNIWNQYLKAALHMVRPWIVRVDLRRRWLELSAKLDEVTLCSVTPLVLDSLTYDRQAEYYKPAIRWASWILRVLSPNLRVGRNQAPGLLFDMNQLFESAVVAVLQRRALDYSGLLVNAQDTGTHLTTLVDSDREQAFGLRPDIVIRDAGKVLAVADTKWTHVEVGRGGYLMPSEAHIYQMQAYAAVYPCEHFTLIYPWHSGLIGSKPTAFCFPMIGSRRPVVSIATIDVGSDEFKATTKPLGTILDQLLTTSYIAKKAVSMSN